MTESEIIRWLLRVIPKRQCRQQCSVCERLRELRERYQ